jgi:hypothetical protein
VPFLSSFNTEKEMVNLWQRGRIEKEGTQRGRREKEKEKD